MRCVAVGVWKLSNVCRVLTGVNAASNGAATLPIRGNFSLDMSKSFASGAVSVTSCTTSVFRFDARENVGVCYSTEIKRWRLSLPHILASALGVVKNRH